MTELIDLRSDSGEFPHPPSRRDIRDDRIVAWLLSMQIRGLKSDEHHGLMTTREVGQLVSLPKAEAKITLERLAEAGRIRKCVYANGIRWRTTNPLPWEDGGTWPPGSVL